jgi:hypothetical protein
VKGVTAGALAAAVWAAGEPALQRLAGTPFSDVRLLGRLVTRARAWPAVGLVLHVGNGALFGAAFERAGLRGVKAGVVAAELENAALWPAMAIVEKIHPDCRDGAWPPLVRNPRIALQEVAAHAVFGAVLGALVRQ